MKLLVLSAPDREDVCEGYDICFRRYGPSGVCPVYVKTPTSSGWTRRFLDALKTYDDGLLAFTLDDYWISRPVDQEAFNKAVSLFDDQSIGFVHLYPIKPTDSDSVQYGYGLFNEELPQERRTLLNFTIARRSYLISVLEKTLAEVSGARDAAWVGAYNYELNAGKHSLGWKVASNKESLVHCPIFFINAVEQGGWTLSGIELAKKVGFEKLGTRYHYVNGQTPTIYLNEWMRAT